MIVVLFQKWPPATACIAALIFALSTLTTNIVANLISPGNDIVNLSPSHISFKGAAVFSVVLASVMFYFPATFPPFHFSHILLQSPSPPYTSLCTMVINLG